jgi:hypothetical protein
LKKLKESICGLEKHDYWTEESRSDCLAVGHSRWTEWLDKGSYFRHTLVDGRLGSPWQLQRKDLWPQFQLVHPQCGTELWTVWIKNQKQVVKCFVFCWWTEQTNKYVSLFRQNSSAFCNPLATNCGYYVLSSCFDNPHSFSFVSYVQSTRDFSQYSCFKYFELLLACFVFFSHLQSHRVRLPLWFSEAGRPCLRFPTLAAIVPPLRLEVDQRLWIHTFLVNFSSSNNK